MFSKTEKKWSADKLLPWQTSWPHQGCEKMLYSTKLILAKWHHWLCKEGYLVPRFEAQIGDITGPHTYKLLMMHSQCVGSPLWLVAWCCRPCTVGLVGLGGRVYMKWRSGVLNKTSSHIWVSWYLPVFLLKDRSSTLIIHGLLDGPSAGI